MLTNDDMLTLRGIVEESTVHGYCKAAVARLEKAGYLAADNGKSLFQRWQPTTKGKSALAAWLAHYEAWLSTPVVIRTPA